MSRKFLILLVAILLVALAGWSESQRSASAQEQGGAPATIAGKTYRSGPASVRFGQDGTFEISGHPLIPNVRGRYSYGDGTVTFADPQENVASVEFPIRCRVEMSGDGFRLEAANRNCSQFDGLSFQRSN